MLALAGIVVSSQIQSFPLWSSVYPAVLIFTTEGTEDHGVSLKLLLGSGCWSADAWFSQRIGQILKNGTSTML